MGFSYSSWTRYPTTTSQLGVHLGGTVNLCPLLMKVPLRGRANAFFPGPPCVSLRMQFFVWKSDINLPFSWEPSDALRVIEAFKYLRKQHQEVIELSADRRDLFKVRLLIVTRGTFWPKLVIWPHQTVRELTSVLFYMLKIVLSSFLWKLEN